MSSTHIRSRASHKKSRLGCSSCKKLRIKCDEGKPKCEYCVVTKRICEYLPVLPGKPRGRSKKTAAVKIAESSVSSGYHQVENVLGMTNVLNKSSEEFSEKSDGIPTKLREIPEGLTQESIDRSRSSLMENLEDLNRQLDSKLNIDDSFTNAPSMVGEFLQAKSPDLVLERFKMVIETNTASQGSRPHSLKSDFDELSIENLEINSKAETPYAYLSSLPNTPSDAYNTRSSTHTPSMPTRLTPTIQPHSLSNTPSYTPRTIYSDYSTPNNEFKETTTISISNIDPEEEIEIIDINVDSDNYEYEYEYENMSLAKSNNGPLTSSFSSLSASNPPLNWFSRLSPDQVGYLQFFIKFGAPVCAMGVPSITNMWRTYCVQVSLQSDIVLNTISAISSYLHQVGMTKDPAIRNEIISREYFHKAITELRDEIAKERNYHNPLELILSSCLVGAFSLMDYDLVPIISRSGGLDLFGIIQGNNVIFSTYYEIVSNSFAKDLIMFDTVEQIDLPVMIAFERLKFLGHLTTTIDELSKKYKISKQESEIYDLALGVFGGHCASALESKTLYPIITMLYELPRPFSQLCRRGRPLALIILAYISAVFRTTCLRARKTFDSWDRCLQSILKEIPFEFKTYILEAIKMRKGFKFIEDTNQLYHLAFWVPNYSEMEQM